MSILGISEIQTLSLNCIVPAPHSLPGECHVVFPFSTDVTLRVSHTNGSFSLQSQLKPTKKILKVLPGG